MSPAEAQVTKIQIISGEVNIVINKQKKNEELSINIDCPGEGTSRSYEPHEEIVINNSETGRGDNEREEMVQCHFYQAKDNIQRHC